MNRQREISEKEIVKLKTTLATTTTELTKVKREAADLLATVKANINNDDYV